MISFNEDKSDSVIISDHSHQSTSNITRAKENIIKQGKLKQGETQIKKKKQLSTSNSEFLTSLGFKLKK